MLPHDPLLKATARRLGFPSLGKIVEEHDEAQHVIGRREHGVAAYQQRLRHTAFGLQIDLAAPRTAMADEFLQAVPHHDRVGAERRQVLQPAHRRMHAGQHALEGFVRQDHAAAGIRHDHRLFRDGDSPAYLTELFLRDQQSHRAELQHHIRYRAADEPPRGVMRLCPRIGGAFDELVPLRERSARRQIGRVSADDDRLERVTAPGKGADAFGAKPHQVLAVRLRHRHRKQAAGDRRERAEARLVGAQGCRGEQVESRFRVEPGADLTHLLRAGDFAGGQHLIVDQEGRAAGTERLQQRGGRIEQRALPLPLAGDRVDHALLETPHGQFRLRAGEPLQRRDAGGDRFRQKLADHALLVVDEPRLVVMAGHETPQAPADHDGHHQGCRHAHVLQVLDVDRRHAPQEAERHVELAARGRLVRRVDGNRLVVHIHEHADTVALVEPPRDLRYVAARIAVAQVGLEMRLPGFGKHLAMTFGIEAVHHHTVVACDRLEASRRLVAQHFEG